MDYFILFALLAAIGWGTSYVFLGQLSQARLSPFVSQLIYGGYMMASSLVLIASIDEAAFDILTWRLFGIATAYSLLSIAGSLAYLYGARLPNASSSLLTAISSCYNVVTLIGNLLFLPGEIDKIDLRYALSGTGLICAGIVLLAYSRRSG